MSAYVHYEYFLYEKSHMAVLFWEDQILNFPENPISNVPAKHERQTNLTNFLFRILQVTVDNICTMPFLISDDHGAWIDKGLCEILNARLL